MRICWFSGNYRRKVWPLILICLHYQIMKSPTRLTKVCPSGSWRHDLGYYPQSFSHFSLTLFFFSDSKPPLTKQLCSILLFYCEVSSLEPSDYVLHFLKHLTKLNLSSFKLWMSIIVSSPGESLIKKEKFSTILQ